MPIKVPNNLPAVDILTKENVFVMTDTRAVTQDIRPLQILILNLMPTKIETETQLTRLLGNSPLQVELELLQTSTHKANNVSEDHMIAFYKTFEQIKSRYYDGMIITGAPVELMDFEEVEYWEELCEIMEWANSHVHSIFYICWGAQAGLYYHYGIKKIALPKKLSGVYKHHLTYKTGMLFRGFDDEFYVPHSRNTTVDEESVYQHPNLKVIAVSEEAGIFACKSSDDKHIFIMGHSEYDGDTLKKEYMRDLEAGLNPEIPCNYFPEDDPSKPPLVIWRSCANLLYSNWLNYFVYQSTPFDLNAISSGAESENELITEEFDLITAKFGGSSLASPEMFKKVKDIILSDPSRRYIVPSAPGKTSPREGVNGSDKITDMLILAAGAETYADFDETLSLIKLRFTQIEEGLREDLSKDDAEKRFSEPLVNIKEEFDIISDTVRELGLNEAYDYIISRGEYLNGKLLASYLGYDFVDAADKIMFDESGTYDEEKTETVMSAELKKYERAVIPGFYGSMPDGRIKTFSRGGSDITGAIVAAVSNADIYENWTDVSGFLMADPTIVVEPVSVPVITYRELRELSYLGADVMHQDAVFPASSKGIPIKICNTNAPDERGTLIVNNARYFDAGSEISGISGRRGYMGIMIRKPHLNENSKIREKLLKVFSDKGINVGNIVAGVDTLTLIVDENEVKQRGEDTETLSASIESAVGGCDIDWSNDIAMIGIVGREISNSPNVAIKILSSLAAIHINVKSIDHGTGNMNIRIAVDEKDYENAVKAIYQQFARIFKKFKK